jgi:hypothetical protein
MYGQMFAYSKAAANLCSKAYSTSSLDASAASTLTATYPGAATHSTVTFDASANSIFAASHTGTTPVAARLGVISHFLRIYASCSLGRS